MNSNSNNNTENLKTFQNRLLLAYCFLVACIGIILSFVFLYKSSSTIRENATELMSANASQIQLNINSYMEKLESTASLLFSSEDYYKYDETSDKYDEYTKIQYESAIVDKIVDLGIMENFSDFGIVYSDNYTVGWISSTTKDAYKDEGLYNGLSKNIVNEMTQDGWFYNVNEGLDRLYYVKRLNSNAVVITSIYGRELASVFTIPAELNGMVIRLVNEENVILYSSDKEEAGEMLAAELIGIIGDNRELTFTSEREVINVNCCENGWRVVSVIPANVILKDISDLKTYTIMVAIILVAVFVIAGVLIFVKVTNPVDTMVTKLEIQAALDGLTKIYNKMTFETKITEELEHTIAGCSIALIIMDVDHFKSINDELGHAYGDQVIIRTAELLKRILPSDSIKGRIGGDEFCFAIKGADKNLDEMREYIEEIITNLSKEFLKEFKEEKEKYSVSLSLGVRVLEYHNEIFKDLYEEADAALYVSKESGRNRYTIYEEGMKK